MQNYDIINIVIDEENIIKPYQFIAFTRIYIELNCSDCDIDNCINKSNDNDTSSSDSFTSLPDEKKFYVKELFVIYLSNKEKKNIINSNIKNLVDKWKIIKQKKITNSNIKKLSSKLIFFIDETENDAEHFINKGPYKWKKLYFEFGYWI